MNQRLGQWIAVAGQEIRKLSVCLTNSSEQPQTLEARLIPVDHIWDYRCETGSVIATTALTVPPGEFQWIEWDVQADLEHGLNPQSYVRLDLLANPMLVWHGSDHILPGHVSAFEMGQGRMRRNWSGPTMSYRIDPPQLSYSPDQVVSGVTRPYQYTNLWRSDPSASLPQWLALEWETTQTITDVELTFPGHLLWEYHGYQPLYRDEQCPSDYSIEVWKDGSWTQVVKVKGNYQRHRRHRLEQSVQTSQVRVVIEGTNGDPSAAIYELRCYS
ncbi:F5/8 type C domain protein [compost metagenome]